MLTVWICFTVTLCSESLRSYRSRFHCFFCFHASGSAAAARKNFWRTSSRFTIFSYLSIVEIHTEFPIDSSEFPPKKMPKPPPLPPSIERQARAGSLQKATSLCWKSCWFNSLLAWSHGVVRCFWGYHMV